MTVDDAVKFLDALTKLVAAAAWPAIAAVVLIKAGPALRDFLSSMGELSLKGGGFEATAKRRQAEAAAALAAAGVARPEAGATPESTAKDARAAGELVADALTPRLLRRARQSRVLWVDDRPSNNLYEQQALEALGVTFELATSTAEGLERLRSERFDAVISDMGRPPDSKAGYTLLDSLRAAGNRVPFIIYAGSASSEHRAEARHRGALGSTNRPNELFELVLTALSREYGARGGAA